MKLNKVLEKSNITVYGFRAFKELDILSNKNGGNKVIATDSPAIMIGRDIHSYYAPVLPRNTVFNTVDDIINADLDLQLVSVSNYQSWDNIDIDKIVIVSRHAGTIAILKDMYANARVLSGNLSCEDIKNCHVIGTLPPYLISYCSSYRAVTINNFDYAIDADLQGQELLDRIVIHEPISVMIEDVTD